MDNAVVSDGTSFGRRQVIDTIGTDDSSEISLAANAKRSAVCHPLG